MADPYCRAKTAFRFTRRLGMSRVALRSAPIALAAALLCGAAWAETDVFEGNAGVTYSHDDNIFRVSPVRLGSSPSSDTYRTLDAGVSMDKTIRLQRLTARHTDTDYPVQRQFSDFLLVNDYTLDSFGGNVDWTYSGKTKVAANVGWEKLSYEKYPQFDQSGATVRIDAVLGLTGKTVLFVSAWRAVETNENLTVSASLNKGISISPRYDVTRKIRLTVVLRYVRRDFSGVPPTDLFFTGGKTRQDNVRFGSVSALYVPTDKISSTLSFKRHVLRVNTVENSYSSKTVLLNLRVKF